MMWSTIVQQRINCLSVIKYIENNYIRCKNINVSNSVINNFPDNKARKKEVYLK